MAAFGFGCLLVYTYLVPFAQTQTVLTTSAVATTQTSVRYALLLKELASVTEKRTLLQTKLQQYKATFDNLQKQLDAKRGLY